MPEAIAERIHPTTVGGRKHLAGFVEVGDVRKRLVSQPTFANDRSAGARVELTIEPLSEVELFGIGKWLIAENENCVLVHAPARPVRRQFR